MTAEIQDIAFPGMPEPGPAQPPVGVAALPEPCWHLLDAEGHPHTDDDIIRHFTTETDAKGGAQDVAEYRADNDLEPETLTPAQLPEPCWTATAACGKDLADSLDGGDHFDSAAFTLWQARECDWQVVGGVLRCDDGEFCTPKVQL